MQPQLLEFFQAHTHQTFGTGEVIVAAGSEPKGIYLVESGLVKMYAVTASGKTYIHNLLKPGGIFPLIWLVADLPNRYYFETLEKVSVFRAEREQTLAFIRSHAAVTTDISRRFLIGMDGYFEHTEVIAEGSAAQKLENTLSMLEKRFGPSFKAKLRLTHQELASLSGLSRETVTRLLSNHSSSQA
jgi:CRP-like cAMP-binding protein